MKRNVILKMTLDVNLYTTNESDIVASKKDNVEESEIFISNLKNIIDNILTKYDFEPDVVTPRPIRKETISQYQTYILDYMDLSIKMILDLRVSNHPVKPDLQTRNQLKINLMKESYDDVKNGKASAEVLDVYYKKHNWGIQIFIGSTKDSDYNKPVNSVESMKKIIENKIESIIDKYFEKVSNDE